MKKFIVKNKSNRKNILKIKNAILVVLLVPNCRQFFSVLVNKNAENKTSMMMLSFSSKHKRRKSNRNAFEKLQNLQQHCSFS